VVDSNQAEMASLEVESSQSAVVDRDQAEIASLEVELIQREITLTEHEHELLKFLWLNPDDRFASGVRMCLLDTVGKDRGRHGKSLQRSALVDLLREKTRRKAKQIHRKGSTKEERKLNSFVEKYEITEKELELLVIILEGATDTQYYPNLGRFERLVMDRLRGLYDFEILEYEILEIFMKDFGKLFPAVEGLKKEESKLELRSIGADRFHENGTHSRSRKYRA